MILMSSAIQIN